MSVLAQSQNFQWFCHTIDALNQVPDQNAFFKNRALKLGLKPDENDVVKSATLAELPSPKGMKDLQKSVDRIMQALAAKERIVIFGDYDVDGTTSCAMLRCFFEILSADVLVYIPDRLLEGYGLNRTGLQKIAGESNHGIL